jgi:hypothetical protein
MVEAFPKLQLYAIFRILPIKPTVAWSGETRGNVISRFRNKKI